jgi:CRP-like cAMP-binding protein
LSIPPLAERPPIETIESAIRRFAAPPAQDIAAFASMGRPRVLKAGEDFCRIGQETHEVAFIHEGILRYYLILPDGDDVTKDFSFTGGFSVSFGSAVSGRPAEVGIAAVVPCRLTVWPYSTFVTLYGRHAEWERFGRRVAETLYVRKERREISLLTESAERRRVAMMDAFPEAAHIPQHYLASYLGIRPQSLSRLKKRRRSYPR